jgi:hypothetical protein
MFQTIVVFLLFFGIIAYKGFQLFKKRASDNESSCAKCGFAKKTEA